MRTTIALALAAALMTMPLVSGSAFSAGDGGGSGGSGGGGAGGGGGGAGGGGAGGGGAGGGGGGMGGSGHSSGGSSSGSGKGSSQTECRAGKVWDRKHQKCVQPQQGMLDDDTLYQAGAHLAMAGRYGEAIEVLGYIADKEQPRVLNYLGYSHRKSGRISVGLGYYEEALRLDPDYTLAREYLGEAYLQLGDVASAKGQLDEIEKRRGKGSREYVLLADQIARLGS
jgi:Tetratricopeptide repeat